MLHSANLALNVLKTDGSLMQVESIAECSLGAFCNTLTCIKQELVFKTNFGLLLSGFLRHVYCIVTLMMSNHVCLSCPATIYLFVQQLNLGR